MLQRKNLFSVVLTVTSPAFLNTHVKEASDQKIIILHSSFGT